MSEVRLIRVPAHTNDVTGQFCPGGETDTEDGRCPHGCDHAEHYSNDGHPECEDKVSLYDLERRAVNSSLTDPSWRTDYR